MAKGHSIHIGVNNVDPDHYAGWNNPLALCEADVNVMQQIAIERGFETQVLKTAQATRDAVTSSISKTASLLEPGDMFLLTYAGHGAHIKDVDGDEEDGKDETWCLYDGQLLDDELNILWSKFAAGVRVLIVSDSCHSGSVSKGVSGDANAGDEVFRSMPMADAAQTFRKNFDFYANLQYALPNPRPEIQACVRLLSGCQDDQESGEGTHNGLFTAALRDALADPELGDGYEALHQNILHRMSKRESKRPQDPNHLVIGRSNKEFDTQRVFTI